MLISFFEEFPVQENLDKLKLLKNETKLYLAAKSLAEFNKLKKKIQNKNKRVKEFIYWPILEKKEGYWISPFSKREALERIFGELKNQKAPIMLDLELPTSKNPLLYLIQFFNFSRNKILIKQFIEDYSGKIYLAEYYPEGKKKEKILSWWGLRYNFSASNNNLKVIKMMYHSLHHFNERFVREELREGVKEWGENFIVAFGTIAPGIRRKEPILPPEQLKRDLQLAEKAGVREVIIYRLEGLNEDYLKVLKKYLGE